MIRWVIASSVKLRGLVLALALAVVVLGVVQLRSMPRDVLPEFGQPTVEVQTEALGLSAPEVEQLITVPLEQDLLNGVPFVDTIHSQSIPGLSSIRIAFNPGTPIARARQVVNERLTQAAGIPNVAKPPQMIQPLSSTSRLMMVGLSSRRQSLVQMGVLARWTMRPRLLGVPGVANVSIWGQRERQLQVQVDPRELAYRGVTLDQVISTTGNALWWSPLGRLEANTPGTGGFFDGPTQRLGIFHESPIKTPKDLAKVPLEGKGDGSVADAGENQTRLGDVARVIEDHQPLIGDTVLKDGPGLLLVIEKLPDANVVEVTRGVDKALDELAPGLADVTVDRSIFRPAAYVDESIDNVISGSLIGLGLVVLLLLIGFFSWRVAIIGGLAIAVSELAAVLVLGLRGETINAMILAGLAVGVVVLVGDVTTDVENILRHRRNRPESADGGEDDSESILEALAETRRPLAYATVIIALALVPIALLEGEVGAFLPPIALSYLLAIACSMLVAFTVTPALSAFLLSGSERRPAEAPVSHWLHGVYDRTVQRMLGSVAPAAATFGVVLLVGALALPFLGRDHSWVPSFRDPTLLVKWDGPPGTSIAEMDRVSARVSRELRALPGIRDVGAHVGRAVLSDRVVGTNSGELWVALADSADYDATVASVRSIVAGYPGLDHAVTSYPTERINQILHRPSRDLTVRVYGANADTLRAKAGEVKRAMGGVDGISGARIESPRAEPTARIEVDLDAAQRAGVKPGDVRRSAATLLSGLDVGALFQDQKVFDVIVWGAPSVRANLDDIRNLVIDSPAGGTLRLGDVAKVRVASTEPMIEHEDVSRFVDIGADVSGRDTADVAADVRRRLDRISFPLEHHAVVLGDYSTRSAERTRFLEVTAAAAIGAFLLFQAAFASWRLAALAIVAVPGAAAGGLLATVLDGGTLSIGSLAGLLVVLTIAVRECSVVIHRSQQIAQRDAELSSHEAVRQATGERFVPIVVASAAAAFAIAPFVLFGNVTGFEIVHPMAVIVLGGLLTAGLVNLIVVPGFVAALGPRPTSHTTLDLVALEAEAGSAKPKVGALTTSTSDA